MLKYYNFMSHILVIKLNTTAVISGSFLAGAILSLPKRPELLETYTDLHYALSGSFPE
jgi:hypothetical protein